MASIHVYVDTRDRQWANPPNMKGLYHAHVDVSELGLTNDEIEDVGEWLIRNLLRSVQASKNTPASELYEVYDNADGGMRKVKG